MDRKSKLLHDLSNKMLTIDFNIKKLSIDPNNEVAHKRARNASHEAINMLMELKKLEREAA